MLNCPPSPNSDDVQIYLFNYIPLIWSFLDLMLLIFPVYSRTGETQTIGILFKSTLDYMELVMMIK